MKEATSALVDLSRAIIAQFNLFCQDNDLVGLIQADHISIKCSSGLIYEGRRKEYESKSSFIYQSIISDRRISLIGLKDPVKTIVGDIQYLELSDQKPDHSQVDRIDHIEVVPITISYDELLQKLKDQGVAIKEVIRPHHTTHDIVLPSGFVVRLSREFLVDKIKREEFI